MRIKVGRFIAFAYLFCVIAPAASLAWGSAPAPCLDDALLADRVPVHHQMQAGHTHDGASHDHARPHAHHQGAAQDAPPTPHHHGGKGTAGPCCRDDVRERAAGRPAQRRKVASAGFRLLARDRGQPAQRGAAPALPPSDRLI
ncbi:hypothetical protein ACVWZ6_003111 [Bradyrhizobium sp. GM6.1]